MVLEKVDIHTRCKDCNSTYALKRISDNLEGPLLNCVFCGSTNLVSGKYDGGFWERLVEAAGMHSGAEQFAATLFNEWVPQTESDKFLYFLLAFHRNDKAP